MANTKQLNIEIEVSYHTLNEIGSQTKNIWLACHGYGQLSEYFIRNFACLNPEENYIIAPQGLSKFYLKEFTGRVGANWMTKEKREQDIQNYIGLFNKVVEQELSQIDISEYNLIFFGFSQGATTITRFALETSLDFSHLILWAGSFPHDAEMAKASQVLNNKDFRYLIGNQDEYFEQDRIDTHMAHLNKNGLQPEVIIFEGGHKVYDDTLLSLGL